MKKSGIGKSGLLAIMLAGGIFLAGFIGCSDEGTTVKVETTPAAAKVFIDGKFVGLSPCECFVRDSQPDDLWEQHVIEVKAKGFETQSRRLRYRTGAAWLPDKIEFVLSPSAMLDDSETSQPETASAEKTQTSASETKEVEYKPTSAPREKEFTSATPWSKAAPINDTNLQPSQKKITDKHAEMEKDVVSTKDVSPITAPKIPDVAPTNKDDEGPVAVLAESAKTATATVDDESEKIEKRNVPITRPRLAPLPKQVVMTEKSARPQFIGSVPWRNISASSRSNSEVELVSAPIKRHIAPATAASTQSAASGKMHSPAAPWIEAGGLSNAEVPQPEEPRTANEPDEDRMFSCDLKIARVSDGVVLRQASGVDTYSNLQELAQDLIDELSAYVPDKSPVAIFCFHNRRQTESGQFIADKMLEASVSAIQKSGSLTYIKTINIRDALSSEISLEQPKQLTKPRFYPLLKNAEYVIIGGVALFDNFSKVAQKPADENAPYED